MSVMTRNSRIFADGMIRQIDRHHEALETTTVMIQITVRGNNPAYALDQIKQAARFSRDIVDIRELDRVIPVDRYEDLKSYVRDLESNLNERVADALADAIQPAEREAVTITDIHRMTSYSYHQITRWLRDGHWNGYKEQGQWRIFTDQSLTPPPAKKRGRKPSN